MLNIWPYRTFLGRMLSISSGAATRSVSAAARACLSKFAAAAVMMTVPDVTPTMWPAASTVATLGLLLDQAKTTLGIGWESPGPTICQARAMATVSSPRNRMGILVRLTCTDASRSVGKTHVAAVAPLNSMAASVIGGPARMRAHPAKAGPNLQTPARRCYDRTHYKRPPRLRSRDWATTASP